MKFIMWICIIGFCYVLLDMSFFNFIFGGLGGVINLLVFLLLTIAVSGGAIHIGNILKKNKDEENMNTEEGSKNEK